MRFEDAMYDAIAKFLSSDSFQSNGKQEFWNFATSSKGLRLRKWSVGESMENHSHDLKMMMRQIILTWKQRELTSKNEHGDDLSEKLLRLVENWKPANIDNNRISHSTNAVTAVTTKYWLFAVCIAIVAIGLSNVSRNESKLFESDHPCYDKGSGVEELFLHMNEDVKRPEKLDDMKEFIRSDFDLFPDTVTVNFYNDPVNRANYNPEFEFQQQKSKIPGRLIHMSEFFVDKHVRYVAVVGGVGYGKTVLLRRIAVDVVQGVYPSLHEVHYVRFINMLEIKSNRTLKQLLFPDSMHIDEEVKTCALRYVTKNPEKFLLVLDGIDKFPSKLGVYQAVFNYDDDVKNTAQILSSLCAGNLIHGLKVLISSREDGIRHFSGGMRPDSVVALSGLPYKSIKKLVTKFGGANHEMVWNSLIRKPPDHLSLASIPMFLMFTITVLDPSDIPPEASSELLMHILNGHVTSNHVTDDIFGIVSKLKGMSFKGLETNSITFTVHDLPDGVSMKAATDLLIPLPGQPRNQKLFDGHMRIHFCHQSIQEALASLHVAEMPFPEFKEFVTNKIHQPKWTMVRRMVCGLLLNQRTFEIAKGNDPTVGLLNASLISESDLEDKRAILLESLKNQTIDLQGDGRRKEKLLELMHVFHESGEIMQEMLQSHLEEINLLNLPLTKSDIHVLLSAISDAKNLTFINLVTCKLDSEDIQNLAYTLLVNDVTVKILLIGNYGEELDEKGAKALLDLQRNVIEFIWLAYRIDINMYERMRSVMKLEGHPDKIFSWWKENGTMLNIDKVRDT